MNMMKTDKNSKHIGFKVFQKLQRNKRTEGRTDRHTYRGKTVHSKSTGA